MPRLTHPIALTCAAIVTLALWTATLTQSAAASPQQTVALVALA